MNDKIANPRQGTLVSVVSFTYLAQQHPPAFCDMLFTECMAGVGLDSLEPMSSCAQVKHANHCAIEYAAYHN